MIAQADEFGSGNTRAEVDQTLNVDALNLTAEDNDQSAFLLQAVAQVLHCLFGDAAADEILCGDFVSREVTRNRTVSSLRNLKERCALPAQLDRLRIHQVDAAFVETDIRTQVPGQHRMLFRGIAADYQNRR